MRLKRLTGAVGTRINASQGAANPWNLRLDYNVNLRRNWVLGSAGHQCGDPCGERRGIQRGAKVQG